MRFFKNLGGNYVGLVSVWKVLMSSVGFLWGFSGLLPVLVGGFVGWFCWFMRFYEVLYLWCLVALLVGPGGFLVVCFALRFIRLWMFVLLFGACE